MTAVGMKTRSRGQGRAAGVGFEEIILRSTCRGRRLGQRATILRSEDLLDTGLGASSELFADRGNGVRRAISGVRSHQESRPAEFVCPSRTLKIGTPIAPVPKKIRPHASCGMLVRQEKLTRSREGPVVRILLPPPASSQIGSVTTCARQAAISACDDQHRLALV